MEHKYRWLNRARLKVHLLESRIQPGSFLITGLVELGSVGHGGVRHDYDPYKLSHNVSVAHCESMRIISAAGQGARAEFTTDAVAHPDQLFDHVLLRAASFADAPLADPL